MTDADLSPWIAELGKPHVMASGERADYSRLEAHLRRYTARNTFDYFIHKDLGTFLRRELDFYIKNEVMHLDDVENESAPRVEQYLSKIKVIRSIAGKDHRLSCPDGGLPEEAMAEEEVRRRDTLLHRGRLHPRGVLSRRSLRMRRSGRSGRRLFAIDQIKGDLTTPGYSKKLSPEFLNAHPTLVVDTRHFDDGCRSASARSNW